MPTLELDSPVSDKSFSYDVDDRETRLELELLDDLQKLGVKEYLDLSQLIVVGEQNAGKSSVLRAMTDIAFPVKSGLCTRFATEIVLRRGAPDFEVCIIPDEKEKPERKEMLKAWRPENFDRGAIHQKSAMEDLFEQVNKVIFGDNTKRHLPGSRAVSRLSSSTLQITRTGPKETNFSIVDIPGLVRGDDDNESNVEYRTAKTLVDNYLRNPRSIIVVVVDIVDVERQAIFNMIDKLPNAESRVIGVINKCDTKEKDASDWVYDLIRNDPVKSGRYFREGWYGLRNRLPSENDISDSERDEREADFFSRDDWRLLDPNKLGRHQLKKALVRMRNRHIKQSIPHLESEIQAKLDRCNSNINLLGPPRTTSHEQFIQVNECATRYSAMAAAATNGNYEDFPSDDNLFVRKLVMDDLDKFENEMTEKGLGMPFSTPDADAKAITLGSENNWASEFIKIPIYEWIGSAAKKFRGKEDRGDVNPQVNNLLWKYQTASWNPISARFLKMIEQTVESVNTSLFIKACPDESLRLKLQAWLQADFDRASKDAKEELRRLVMSETQIFTLHPNKRAIRQNYHAGRVQAIKTKFCTENSNAAKLQTTLQPSNLNPVDSGSIVNSLLYKDEDLVEILKTHDSLAAHYQVALYRFIDNFALQVIERHLLGPQGPLKLFNSAYVGQKLYGEKYKDELEKLAGEDPEVAEKRKRFEDERVSLEESKKRVQNFKIL